MKRMNQLIAPHGTTSLFGVLVAIALVFAGSAADAQQRVKPINGKAGVKSVAEGRGKGDARAVKFAHVVGFAEYSSSRGLTVDGLPVNISGRTSVFPNVSGESSGVQPRQFSGRELTVFGEITSGAVNAVLVIVKPVADSQAESGRIDDPNVVTSTTDPRVGVVRESAPE